MSTLRSQERSTAKEGGRARPARSTQRRARSARRMRRASAAVASAHVQALETKRPRRGTARGKHAHAAEEARAGEAVAVAAMSDAEVDALLAEPIPARVPRDGGRRTVGPDLLQRYFASVEQYRLLTPQQELALARRYLATGDPASKERLINANLRLAAKIAYRYRSAFPDLLDLIQEANVGLVRAVDRYDPERGVRFTTYAAFWIRATVIRFILTHARNVRVKTQRPGERKGPAHEVSIDAPIDSHAAPGEGTTYGDLLADDGPGPESQAVDGQLSDKLDDRMTRFASMLDDRDRYIFEQRFSADERLSLRDLGAKIGICQERVRQLEQRLVRRARAFLEQEGLIPD